MAPTKPVARRWKGQINENAKAAAFWSELPEADHNELCAWEGTLDLPLRAVFLDAPALDRRLATRLALTADEVAAAGVPVEQVHAVGSSPLKQLLSLVLLGDLVSIYLAVLAGRDPTPVQAIERFKAALAAFA